MSIKAKIRLRARHARRALFEFVGSDRYSRMGQFNIEEKLTHYFGDIRGTFIEAGAHDGLSQSNTYWLESMRGWKGLLVEPVPAMAALCRRNRPKAKVVNAALVATPDIKSIRVAPVGLYGYVTGSLSSAAHEAEHRRRGAQNLGTSSDVIEDIEVPARTLENILDELRFGPIDLFSLDVEGYEINVLRGMNVARYKPHYMLVEAVGPERLLAAFGDHYEFVEQITPQDVLLKARD
jgi:FkbM family methyltransferase